MELSYIQWCSCKSWKCWISGDFTPYYNFVSILTDFFCMEKNRAKAAFFTCCSTTMEDTVKVAWYSDFSWIITYKTWVQSIFAENWCCKGLQEWSLFLLTHSLTWENMRYLHLYNMTFGWVSWASLLQQLHSWDMPWVLWQGVYETNFDFTSAISPLVPYRPRVS